MSASQQQSVDLNDIVFTDWVERWLPRPWRPYARLCRLDRPIGTWLTLLPCIAALVQAAGGLPDLRRLLIFSLGACSCAASAAPSTTCGTATSTSTSSARASGR